MIQIILIGDQPAVRQGLRMRLALEPDIAVVAEAGNITDALQAIAHHRPDAVVIDLDSPAMNVFAAIEAIHALRVELPIFVLSMIADADTQKKAKHAGASALVEKHRGVAELLSEIRRSTQTTHHE